MKKFDEIIRKIIKNIGKSKKITFTRNNKVDFKKRRKIFFCIVSFFLIILIFFISSIFGNEKKHKNIVTKKDVKYMNFSYNDEKKYLLSKFTNILEEYEESLNIQEVEYQWGGNLNYKNIPEKLIIHHIAGSGLTPERLNEIHIGNGWDGIGYHFYIRTDGKIYRGRPEKAVGAHAKKNNNNSIGIVLEGDFEKDKPTEAQMKCLVNLSVDMIIKYNLKEVVGHRDVYETLCPGENLSIEELRKKIAEELDRLENQ